MDPMVKIKDSRSKWESFLKEEGVKYASEKQSEFMTQQDKWKGYAGEFVDVFFTEEQIDKKLAELKEKFPEL